MQTPIATDSMVLGSLPTRNARYRPQPTAVIIAGGTHGEPTATGIATLVNDASPRVIVATSGERALRDDVRSRCAEGVAPTWVLVGSADDEGSADCRAFAPLIAAASDAEPDAHVSAGDLWTLIGKGATRKSSVRLT